ncbi:MAG: PAS domain-containing protein [Bradyrhizobium sp.]
MNLAQTPASDLPTVGHSLMERSPVPMAELRGAGHVVQYANPAFCRLTDKSKEALVGTPFAEAMQDGDTCLAMLDRVYRTGKAQIHTETEQLDSHPVYWSYAMWPVVDAQQRTVGVMMQVTETTLFHQRASAMNEALLVSSVRQHERTEAAENLNDRLQAEIAERRRVERALRDSERRLREMIDALPTAVYTTDSDGRLTHFNPAAAEFSGRTPELGADRWCVGWKLYYADGKPMPHDECPMAIALKDGRAVRGTEAVLERPDGQRFWFMAYPTPLRDVDGRIVGGINMLVDITDRKQADLRQRLLLNELAHRGRNLLGLIQTLVSRSLSGNRSLTEAREALMQRIQALARSQTMLVQGAFEGARLVEMVRLQFEAFSDRVEARGPDIMLSPRAAQTFSLLLHELATNATKYGALSQPGGKVAIDWSIEGAEPEARFMLRWMERGGPPVAPPSHRGFGVTLLEKAAAHEFGAPPKIKYEPKGLRYEIDTPLSAVAARADVEAANIESLGRDMSNDT